MTAEEAEVDVTWEDQQKINTFGRLNIRKEEIEDEVAELKEEINKINDAADEIIISDDIKFTVGEVFVDVQDSDAGEEMLERERRRTKDALNKLDSEYELVTGKMKELKAQLYAKFGKNINLEYERAK